MKLDPAQRLPARSLRPGCVLPALARLSGILSLPLLALLTPQPGLAGTLSVTPAAAFADTYGLEINVDWACTAVDDLVVPSQTITSTEVFEGCISVTAGDVDIQGTGDVTFRAGSSITLKEGFSVGPTASFAAVVDHQLSPYAYLQDDSPAAETMYNARFYLRADALLLGPNDEFDLFVASATGGSIQFRLFMRDILGGAKGLGLAAFDNSGSMVETPAGSEVPLPNGWHPVEIEWQRAAPGQNDGHLKIWLDGQPAGELANLVNDLGQIDSVQWGAAEGMDLTTTGVVQMDEFISGRNGYIGPMQ